MKLIALAFLLSPAFAGPQYPVPEDSSRFQVTCAFTQIEMRKTSDRWTPWTPVQGSYSYARAIWMDAKAFYVLEEGPGQVVYRRVTEETKGPGLRERVESVEEWTDHSGKWSKEEYEVVVTLITREGAPLRRIETREGQRPYYWDITTIADQGVMSTQKVLRNPSAMNTEFVKISSFQETCATSL